MYFYTPVRKQLICMHQRLESFTDGLQLFVKKCVQKIVNTHWADKVSNRELWRKLTRIKYQLRKRIKWK